MVIDYCLHELQAQKAAGVPINDFVCESAAAKGDLECLRFADEHAASWDAEVCIKAAQGNHPECLAYSFANRCPVDTDVAEAAASVAAFYGSLECLKLCLERKIGLHADLCGDAARGGSAACLKYCREAGCPWDKGVAITAAANGNLDCLEYCFQQDGVLDPHVSMGVSVGRSVPCLLFALRNGCPKPCLTRRMWDDVFWACCRLGALPEPGDAVAVDRYEKCVATQLARDAIERVVRNHAAVIIQTEWRKRTSYNPHCSFGRRFLTRLLHQDT